MEFCSAVDEDSLRVPPFCILCSAKCLSKTHSTLADCGVNIVGGQNCSRLVTQLEQMFVLLKILEIPSAWCADNILTATVIRQDNCWFNVCGDCTEKNVAKCWNVHQQILALYKQLASLQRSIKERMKQRLKSTCGEWRKAEGTVEYEIGKLLFPDLFVKHEVSFVIDDYQSDCEDERNGDDMSVSATDDDPDFIGEKSNDHLDFKDDDSSDSSFLEQQSSVRKGSRNEYKKDKKSTRTRNYFKWKLCRACGTRFNTLQEYDAHHLAHVAVEKGNSSSEFVCEKCTFPARTEKELKLHRHRHHRKPPSEKNDRPQSQQYLKLHKKRNRNEGYDCPKCPLQTQTWRDLKQHVDQQHSSMTDEELTAAGLTLKCLLCDDGKQFGKLNALVNHQTRTHSAEGTNKKQHPLKKPLKPRRYHKWKICRLCDSRYKTQEEFNVHLQTHGKEQVNKEKEVTGANVKKPTYDCPICPLRTEMWKHLKEHVLEVHPTMTDKQKEEAGIILKCYLCKGQHFESIQRWTSHKRLMHPELESENNLLKPHTCSTCGRKFVTEQLLRNHERRKHKLPANFVCDTCGMGFPIKSGLESHKITHLDRSEKEQFICHLCGLDFSNKYALKKHCDKQHPPASSSAASCSTGKIFKCRYCDLTSPTALVIQRHAKTHKEQLGHSCNLCEKSYSSAAGLSRHIRINHSSQVWPCPHCSKPFPCEDYMKDHVRRFCHLKRLVVDEGNPQMESVTG